MTDEIKSDEAPTEDEVISVVGRTAKRLATELVGELGELEISARARAALEDRIRATLLEDDEVATAFVLRGAFEEGVADTALEFARAGADPAPRAPDWSDITSPGERKAILREENLCARCSHAAVCVVARTAPAELLLVVRRCAAFTG